MGQMHDEVDGASTVGNEADPVLSPERLVAEAFAGSAVGVPIRRLMSTGAALRNGGRGGGLNPAWRKVTGV